MKIEIEIDDESAEALRGLAKFSPAVGAEVTNAMESDVVEYLIACVTDGVRRPGSWERPWLYNAFSSEWESMLETYDDYGHERFIR